MFEDLAAHIQALPAALQIVGVVVLLSLIDFALAVIAAMKNGTFHGTLLGQWVLNHGLPVVTVALLYILDAAVTLFSVDVGDTNLGMFGIFAYGQALTLIASHAMSIIKNGKLLSGTDPNPPVTEP